MGSQNGAALVSELQRRITNLDSTDALAAINRACRWINRQSSYQFMATTSATLAINTPSEASVLYSGTIQMKSGDPLGYHITGSAFDATGAWGVVTGPIPGPLTETGHSGLTITINGDDYMVYWVGTYTGGWGSPMTDGLMILGDWPGADGTYDWSLTVGGVSASNGPADLDPGKAKLVLNADGSPVQHVPVSEFWASLNYNTVTNFNYDSYTIVTDNTQNPPTHQFFFFPSLQGAVTLYYHKMLTDVTTSTRTQFPRDFDDLVVDLAEAEERRIYDVGDTWQLLMARAQDQIKVLIDGYKNMTHQPGMVGESAAAVQEATQLGRA